MARTTDRSIVVFGVLAAAAMLVSTWTPFLSGSIDAPDQLSSLWSLFGSDALIGTSIGALVLMMCTFLRADWSVWLNRLVAVAALAALGLLAAHPFTDVLGASTGRVVYWAVYPPVALIAALQIMAAHRKTRRNGAAAADRIVETAAESPAPSTAVTTADAA